MWGLAALLLLVLFAIAWMLEHSRESHVWVDGPLALPAMPSSQMTRGADEPIDDSVQLTDTLALEGPTTLDIAIATSASSGWLGVDVALVEIDTLEIRELWVGLDRASAPEPAARTAHALVDRLPTGRYMLRLAPRWEAVAPASMGRAEVDPTTLTPPRVHLRVTSGRQSYTALALAAFLVLLPPMFVSARRLLRNRRSSEN